MICKVCNYNSETNNSETDWKFWKMSDVVFEFERQEFTDEKECMNGTLLVCPKCFSLSILPTSTSNVALTEDDEQQGIL